MMLTHVISRNKLLNSLEWIFFITLTIFAIWFCWPMVGQYQTKQTSLSQSKTDVQERPTITICFETRHLHTEELNSGNDETVNYGDSNSETVDYGAKVRFALNEDFTIAYSSGIDPHWTYISK